MVRSTLKITVDPSPARLAKALGPDLRREFADYREAWHELLPLWARGLEQNVRSEGSALGENWPPPSDNTVRQRGPGQPGIATGRMISRLRSPTASRRSLTKRKLSVGPAESYPYILHFGAKSRGQPARPFIGVSPAMERVAEEVVDRFMRRRLEALAHRVNSLVRGR